MAQPLQPGQQDAASHASDEKSSAANASHYRTAKPGSAGGDVEQTRDDHSQRGREASGSPFDCEVADTSFDLRATRRAESP
ncbi:MAG: hypothetical protein LC746_14385, partial [Acidobacteria bacterium]|nr:hypothetical protein [Acidobacteriota bacterium]